ncbi:MAG: deoxycytidine triphosphate deaminase [Candidatus Riflebacteria bacterium]|nr:deoxycytidine triphosphate deaminase [Candidatus Riflebacteria bacterium]
MLSDQDLFRELGTSIYIFPFNKENIKGSSINLTASSRAWSVQQKKTIFNKEGNKITIPAGETGLIETNEVIYVSNKISGTYHSKVGLASSGVGHVGTTLDPCWIGPSLIAIHNHSGGALEILVNSSFVSVCFYYLRTPSKYESTNKPGQTDVLAKLEINYSQDASYFENDWVNQPEALKRVMLDSNEFKLFREKLSPISRYLDDIKFFVKITLVYLLIIGIFYGIEHFSGIKTHPLSNWLTNVGPSGWFLGIIIYFASKK